MIKETGTDMLGFGKSKEHSIVAVCDGIVKSLDDVNDKVFSDRILGDGCAIVPHGNVICSPGEGEVISVAETGHAYCIGLVSGAEVLVHIGIDTVALKGEGFTKKVNEGEKVYPGKAIAEVDLDLLKNEGYDTTVITIITNTDDVGRMTVNYEAVKGGVSPSIVYKMK